MFSDLMLLELNIQNKRKTNSMGLIRKMNPVPTNASIVRLSTAFFKFLSYQ
jgi:hypothetical protein